MAYRQPQFMLDHPVADLDLSAITQSSNTATVSDASKRAWRDHRQGVVGTFEPAVSFIFAGPHFDFGGAVNFNQCIVPKGHNWPTGKTPFIAMDDNPSFSSVVNKYLTAWPGGSGVIDMPFTAGTERYWFLRCIESSSGEVYELPEIWFGLREEISTAVAVNPGWDLGFRFSVENAEAGGSDLTIETAPRRRVLSLDVGRVAPGGADHDLLERVAAMADPFWFWPPDDQAEPYLVKIVREPRIEQDSRIPLASLTYRYRFEFVEQRG